MQRSRAAEETLLETASEDRASPDEVRDASPIYHVGTNSPRFYIAIGENDHADLIEQVEPMRAALEKVGTHVETTVLPGCDHFQSSLENGKIDGVWATTVRKWMSQP